MKRREFAKLLGMSTLTWHSRLTATEVKHVPVTCEISPQNASIYDQLVDQNDGSVERLLLEQERDTNHPWFGGMADVYGIFSAGRTAHFIKTMVCAFCAPESRFFMSTELIEPMENASSCLLKSQHDDGTIDLYTTNFHSPPDTGFVLEPLCAAYSVLDKIVKRELSGLKSNLQLFIRKGGDALSVGGIHTPNHRWVVCMALARIHALFPQQKYIERIDDWLGENIDIDPDGQYTEKSTAIYSPLTDRCLMTVARLLDRQHLYDPVRANLHITMYYLHSDGEVVTTASKRQDRDQRGSAAPYYYPYRFMALKDHNRKFSAMAKRIERLAIHRLTETLVFFLEQPALQRQLPAVETLPTRYTKHFSHSKLVRIRRENVSATIFAENTTFFSFHKGSAALEALRFASAFFGKGQFKSDTLEVRDNSYILQQKLAGPYYQPFPKDDRPENGDWNKMPRSSRSQSEVQYLESTVIISESDGRFRIRIDISGTKNVPVAVEMAFRHGGELSGVSEVPGSPDSFFLRDNYGRYRYGDEFIEFGPGQNQHLWTQLRGAETKLDAQCVYLTGFTPFSTVLEIA